MVKTLKCFSDYVTHCLLLWAMLEEVGVGCEGVRGERVFGVCIVGLARLCVTYH